jgi:hypothetical protein
MEPDLLQDIGVIIQQRQSKPLTPSTTNFTSNPNLNSAKYQNPKLGAAYNVFDGEELLEQSIRSIRPVVSYVVVVYQTQSNFGEACSSSLVSTLERLRDVEHLIDEIIHYHPQQNFTNKEKKYWVSARATGTDLGGARYFEVANPFFNEISKRELGRVHCLKAKCTHFMCMDTDEYYQRKELATVWSTMMQGDYDCVACKMRFFFKFPRCELYPRDEQNYVTAIFKLQFDMPLRLAHPYANLLIDPTRRMFGATKLLICRRDELEMYHYSFVRLNILSKLVNVTNRGNYTQEKLSAFIQEFPNWTPDRPLCHPHPYFASCFQKTRIVPNWFEIHLGAPYEWRLVDNLCVEKREKMLRACAVEHFKYRNFDDAGDLYIELSLSSHQRTTGTTIAASSADAGIIIALDPRLAHCANAATCRLKMKRYEECIELCNHIVNGKAEGMTTDGTRAKALYTRALACFSISEEKESKSKSHGAKNSIIGMLEQCVLDLETALTLQGNKPSSQVIKLLKKVKKVKNSKEKTNI